MSQPHKLPPGAVRIYPPPPPKEKGPEIVDTQSESDDTADVDVPAPQPVYMHRTALDGRSVYVPKGISIIVEGEGVVELSRLFNPASPGKISNAQASLNMDIGGVASDIGKVFNGGDGVYTTRDGKKIDVDIPVVPEKVENIIEEAAETIVGTVDNIAGDGLAGKAVDSVIDKVEEEVIEAGEKVGFLKRRIEQEDRINGKVDDLTMSFLNHPGVKQPIELLRGLGSGFLKFAEAANPTHKVVVHQHTKQ